MGKNGKNSWDVQQYEKFKQERAQAFFDLLELIKIKPNMRILDLGCGTGELTKLVHGKFSAKETIGLDSSESMLKKSQEFASSSLHFLHGDISKLNNISGPFDLIISNAALHWVGDHESIFEKVSVLLAPQGQIAFQLPANYDQPSHELARKIAQEEPFKEAFHGYVIPQYVLALEKYAEILDKLGFSKQKVFLNVYAHHLDSRDGVLEWVRGALLTVYKERLSLELYEQFLKEYQKQIRKIFPDEKPFFYPFKRIFIWGIR